MSENDVLEILKKAIIFERQGQRFYESIAEQTNNEAVKKIFTTMASEESGHEKTLLDQYRKFADKGAMQLDQELDVPDEFSEKVLTEEVRSEIDGAGYEAAAISAAMGLEQKTVDLYSSREKEASDSEEKRLYRDLAAWETTHLQFLSNLHREILQNTFFDGVD